MLLKMLLISLDESGDEIDGLLPHGVKGLMGKTRVDKMIVYWVSFLDGLQRVLLFTQDERIASSIRKVGVDICHCCVPLLS